MASPETRIVELANRIAANTAVLNDYLTAHGLPTPSFDLNGPKDTLVPKEETDIEAARVAIIDDAQELRRLVLGPREYLMSYTVSLAYRLHCQLLVHAPISPLSSTMNSSANKPSRASASLMPSPQVAKLLLRTLPLPADYQRQMFDRLFAMPSSRTYLSNPVAASLLTMRYRAYSPRTPSSTIGLARAPMISGKAQLRLATL